MAQQREQIRVGALRDGSLKPILLANGDRCEVDSNIFSSGKALY
jgi:hypothetical protein